MPDPDLHLYTHEFFPKRGGISTYCHEFANAATEMGYRVTVHAPGSARAPHETTAYTLRSGKAQGNHNPKALFQTRKLLEEMLLQYPHDLHLLAEPGPILAFGLLSVRRFGAARTIATVHGSEISRWRSRSLRGFFGRKALGQASAICAVSNPIRSLTAESFPDLEKKTHAVLNALPSGLKSAGIQSAGIQNPQLTKDENGSFELLSVGRIHRRKGFDHIIHALALLPENLRCRVRYTIGGGRKDETYRQELIKLARQKGVVLRLQLDLDDSSLSDCYRHAHLFALTSIPYKNSLEGFGLVYLEAGAHALPCIGYDNGGVRDAIRDGETGYLVDSGSIESLSAAIKKLIEQPDERMRLARNNHRFALARSWEDVVRETLAVIE